MMVMVEQEEVVNVISEMVGMIFVRQAKECGDGVVKRVVE